MHDGLERGGNLLRRSPRKKREREKERKKWVAATREFQFLTRRERQQRRLSQSVGTDWKEAAHSSAELDSKQSREREIGC